MTGFKDEKALWKYQKPRLKGKWMRVECVTPSGHPDVVGSWHFRLTFIENKVGDLGTAKQRLAAMEADQVTYCDWLVKCGHDVYVAFGSKKTKAVAFYHWKSRLVIPCVPEFWRG